ncbi:MAG: TonB-dependent receptor [Nitrospira sp.]|nr:TonB-dependent receptor [Nitrospira sp.]
MMSTTVCRPLCRGSRSPWVFFVFALHVFFSGLAHSQENQDSEGVHKLDPVVVVATKTPVPMSQLTSAVEVLTQEDFQRRNIKSITEALRLSQSLAVFSNGGPGTNTTIRMRGGTSSQTLVLIDGAMMNSGTSGSFNFGNLMTDNIERIEILRGAQSTIWGSDAIGGVIHITTRRGSGAPKASGFFEYGSFNSIREGGSVAGKSGPVDFSASLSRWDFGGFSTVNFRRGAGERDAYRNWTGSTQLGVSLPKDGRLSFQFRWMNGDTDFDNSSTFGGGPFDVYKLKSTDREFVYSGIYHQPITTWWEQQLTLARNDGTSDTQAGTLQRSVQTGVITPTSPFNNSTIRTQNNRLEWQHNFQIGDPWLVTLGYQYRDQRGTNEGQFSEKVLSSHAGFAQMQLNLWDRLFATAGFRQESHNTFGDATTYRVTGGYVIKETDTKIRASYATGFRAPSINESFFPNFGNPNLKPEKSQSLDVGIEQHFFQERVTVGVGYFWNRYRQLIATAFDPVGCPPGFGFCAQNIGSAKSQGWEANARLVLAEGLPFMKMLDLQGQYTYTITRDLETAARLPRWPVHQGSLVLTYQPHEPLILTATFRYVGSRFNTTGNRQPLSDYHVINIAASYAFTSSIQGYVRAENLLNRQYEEIQLFGTPVRSVYGGIRVNFDLPVGSANP